MTLMKCLITDGGVFFLCSFCCCCLASIFFVSFHLMKIVLMFHNIAFTHLFFIYFFFYFRCWPPEGGVNVIFYILPLIYFNIKQFPPLTGKTKSNSIFFFIMLNEMPLYLSTTINNCYCQLTTNKKLF